MTLDSINWTIQSLLCSRLKWTYHINHQAALSIATSTNRCLNIVCAGVLLPNALAIPGNSQVIDSPYNK